MLSVLTLGAARGSFTDGATELDPGVFSLIARMVRSFRAKQSLVHEDNVATFIEANGRQLSDNLERRIGAGIISGRF